MADVWELRAEYPELYRELNSSQGYVWQPDLGRAHKLEQMCLIHASYWQRYGALARLPVPLRVDREGRLTYWYSQVPDRVADLSAPPVSASLSMLQRLGHLRQLGDPRTLTKRWVELTGRLLCLGFVADIQPSRLVVDGGLADLELTSMHSLELYSEVEKLVQQTHSSLADSIGYFLLGSKPGEGECLGPVEQNLRQLYRNEQERGLRLPLPLANQLKDRPGFDLLVEKFRERWP